MHRKWLEIDPESKHTKIRAKPKKDFYGTKKWTPVCYIAGFGDPEIEHLPRLMDTKTIGKMDIFE